MKQTQLFQENSSLWPNFYGQDWKKLTSITEHKYLGIRKNSKRP